jgi:non-specific serine/threonine protein kinase
VAAAERLQGPGQVDALRALEADHDNLRVALRWLLDHGEAEVVARLGGSLWLFWGITGDLREGGAWMAEALARGAALTPAARAGAQLVTGTAALQARTTAAALEQVDESRRLFEAAGDERRTALALLFVGRADEARRRFQALGDAAGEAFALASLAEEALLDGALERAGETYEASLACARAAQDVRAVAHALDGLGLVALHRRQPERAWPLLAESVTLCLQMGHEGGLWYPLLDLAAAAQMMGDPVRAARLFGAAEALRLRQGANVPPEHQSIHQRTEAALRARLGDGEFAAAAAEGGGLNPAAAAADALATASPPPSARREPGTAAPDALTAREQEVAALIGRGLTSKEIASVLVITERTADTHAERIRSKLGLRSRAEIAAWAVRHGLQPAHGPS